MHLKDQMIHKNRKFIHKCISCDRYTHNAINCPRIHFIHKDIKILIQQRKDFQDYINNQNKKKKYNRANIRYSWKLKNKNG